jgi:hypothetical protein
LQENILSGNGNFVAIFTASKQTELAQWLYAGCLAPNFWQCKQHIALPSYCLTLSDDRLTLSTCHVIERHRSLKVESEGTKSEERETVSRTYSAPQTTLACVFIYTYWPLCLP